MQQKTLNQPERMPHLPSLIFDLALILISAGVVTLLFKAMNQPLVLGYIVAGILAGPYVSIVPVSVKDTANIQIWAEIGVIFLLFALGLDFSFKKLVSVGKTAFITASVIVIGMMSVGFITGILLGWDTLNSLFLGGMLSMSSTTIIYKAFNDKGVSKEPYAKNVFGVLIVEDLIAIILMVLLSTISMSKQFDGSDLLMSISKLIFFLILWFIFGIFLIPSLLKKVRNLMSDETLLILSTGLCLSMVIFAVKSGFSAALGAFIMGSILAETNDVHRIEKLMDPLKNLFGAIFFVSVGMMVQPEVVVQYFPSIILLVAIVIVGQIAFSTTGFILSGKNLKSSIQSGFSMGQLGEFAFIIASLGVSLKVTDPNLYPIVIAVSVVTIFATPYFMRLSEPAYKFASNHLPKNWLLLLDKKSQIREKSVSSKAWNQLITDFITYTVVLSALIVFVFILTFTYISPFMDKHLPISWAHAINFLITLVLVSPFLRAMMNINGRTTSTVLNLSLEKPSNKKILHLLTGLRLVVVFTTLIYLTNKCFTVPFYINVFMTLILVVIILRSRWLLKSFWRLETRFLINLNERQMEDNYKRIEANKGVMDLSDMHANHWLDYKLFTCALRLRPHSGLAGQSIKDLSIRQEYNIMVLRIRTKTNDFINIPSGDYVLQEGDTLRLAGKRSALKRMQQTEIPTFEFVDHSFMTLHGFSKLEFERKEQKERLLCAGLPLKSLSPLNGKNLIESNLGAKAKCLVVGLERAAKQIVNPEATTTLLEGDVVWIVGEEKPVSRLIQSNVYGI